MDITPEDLIKDPELPELPAFTHEQEHELLGWAAHMQEAVCGSIAMLPEDERPVGAPLLVMVMFGDKRVLLMDPARTLADRRTIAEGLAEETIGAIHEAREYEARLAAAQQD